MLAIVLLLSIDVTGVYRHRLFSLPERSCDLSTTFYNTTVCDLSFGRQGFSSAWCLNFDARFGHPLSELNTAEESKTAGLNATEAHQGKISSDLGPGKSFREPHRSDQQIMDPLCLRIVYRMGIKRMTI